MRALSLILGGSLMTFALSAVAVDPKATAALAQQKACMACHAIGQKLVGPSYKDVAKKYKGNPAAVATLSAKVKKGGGGVWGSIPMPANNVTDAEAKQLVEWVLSQ